ncbi:hypothetical protein [Levilactobacillus wangkuiensis]|uniref:hypothetical protein n=1 Tax=Levilactobacillus wangkuiensis TaxID=2799566 RepID=UPI001944421D|nr:hypothetical protein [Levilactobacillus wangkuiensis]
MGIFVLVVIIGITAWCISANKEKERERVEKRKELFRQEKEKQLHQEQIKREQIAAERIKNRNERLNRERERQAQEKANKHYKELTQESVAKQKTKKEFKEIPSHFDPNQFQIDFHFRFFYEESLNAIIVVFGEKSDWQKYKLLVREDKEYSLKTCDYLKNNFKGMKEYLEVSSTDLYLLPVVSKPEDLGEVSKMIKANEESTLNAALLKLNDDGQLVDGEIFELLHPNTKSTFSTLEDEAHLFMEKINYFIWDDSVIVYFKNENVSSDTLEKITDSMQQVAHFCQMMRVVKDEIDRNLSVKSALPLLLVPGAADDDVQAGQLVHMLLNGEGRSLKKLLLVIDAEGNISDGILGRAVPVEMLDSEANTSEVKGGQGAFNVYEWYIKKTNEVFYVGIGYGGKLSSNKNDLFLRVKEKFPSDFRYVGQNLTKEAAVALKERTMKVDLSAGNVLTNIQVPMGYAGGLSTSAETTSYGARKFNYLEKPRIVGNIVEEHYGLIESAEAYDDIDVDSLRKTVVPTYSLVLEEPLYFKTGSGNTAALIDRLKDEIQEKASARIYKSLAKSAESVILTNGATPARVRELHSMGYKVFHMVDVINFLKLDLEQITNGLD